MHKTALDRAKVGNVGSRDARPLALPNDYPALRRTKSGASLMPGVLDDAARRFFTSGQCHALALAISERTGWPIVGINWRAPGCDCNDDFDLDGTWCECDSEECFPRHVVVRHPSGRLLDVRGWVDEGSDWFFADDSADLKPDHLDRFLGRGWFHSPDMGVARQFVDPVLKQIGHP